MFVAVLALTCGMLGCGSIQDDYIEVNEDAYRLIGDEHLSMVEALAAPKGAGPARTEALSVAAGLCRDRGAAEQDPTARDVWMKRAETLDGLAPAAASTLTPDQAANRRDTILAWWSALEEGRQHRGGGKTPADLPALPPPRGSGVERAPPGDAVTTPPESGR